MIKDTNLEYMVIGALLKFPELYGEFMLKPEMFYDPYAKNVINFIWHEKKVDKNEIYLQAKKHEQEFITTKLIKELVSDKFIMKSHFTNYQTEVLDIYKARKLSEASKIYAEKPDKESLGFLKSTMEYLDTLYIHKSDSKKEVIEEIVGEIYGDIKPNIMKTGFNELDKMIGGFEPGQLIVVAARPSAGKTAFALNMAQRLEDNGCNVAVFSLETTSKKILHRMIASATGINLEKFKYPESLTVEDLEKITTYLQKYKDGNIRINQDSNVTPADIRRTASVMQEESDRNVIIIDYLTLMKSDSKIHDRRLEVEDISRKLKILSKEYKCTVIALSQLSRGVESRNDKRPMMSDIREAGGIEQDADMIFMLYRDDYYNKEAVREDGKSEIEVICAKNKDGATGTVKMDFYKKNQRFFG